MGMRLAPLFGAGELRDIVDRAIDALAEIGVACGHGRFAAALAERAKVEFRGGRLHLDRESLRAHLDSRKRRPYQYGAMGSEWALVAPWCSFRYCDPSTNEPRDPTMADVVVAARTIDLLTEGPGPFGGPVPIYVPGVDPRLSTMANEKAAVLHTRRLGGKLTALDPREIGIISSMYSAVGRRYRLALQGMISPLRLNDEVLDCFLAEDGNEAIDLEISCSIPMVGATAPLAFPAALVQATAEAIAGDYIFNTMSGRGFDVLVVRLEPFDMRSGNIVFGSPEWCVFNKACVDLEGELRGEPRRYGVFRTGAKRVDAQSMAERSMSVITQAYNGVRRFGATGQLCVDEVFSPLQAVLDREILLYARRVVRGLDEAPGGGDPLDAIREGLEGTYLDTDLTIANFREVYDYSHSFAYNNYESWRQGGKRGIEDVARDRLAELLAEAPFSPPAPAVAEVERIYAEGAKALMR